MSTIVDNLDKSISGFLNSFSGQYPGLDLIVVIFVSSHFLKSAPVLTLLWWSWFSGTAEIRRRRREYIVATMTAALGGLLVARLLVNNLPFRPRPLHDAAMHFRPPMGLHPNVLSDWSAFPSDHAVLFTALALGLTLAHRIPGLFILVYVLVAVFFPRLYAGFHYPSDMLAGALLGAVLVLALGYSGIRRRLAGPVLTWEERHPASFYAVAFLLAWQIAMLFDPLRELFSQAQFVFRLLR